MIEPKPTISRAKIWRLGKDGFESTLATIVEWMIGTSIEYDPKFKLEEKEYRAKCDVCLAQEQGYGCAEIQERPGPYEEEGGCMDCKYLCRKPPVYIGVRNYCKDHIGIMNKKLGVKTC